MEDLYKQQQEVTLIMGIYGLLILGILYYLQSTQRMDKPNLTKSKALTIFGFMSGVGIVARLYFAYFLPGHPTDMNCFSGWATYSYQHGLDHFYDGEIFADYPPLYIYVLYSIGWIQNVFELDSASMGLLLRIPAIISDIVISWIVYNLAVKRLNNRNSALVLSSLILLNPAVITNSAIWGQIDSIQVLMLIGIIWLLGKHRIVGASVLFMLAVSFDFCFRRR